MILTLMNFLDALTYPSMFVTGYITTCIIMSSYQSQFKRLYIVSPTYKNFLKYTTTIHNAALILYSAYSFVAIAHAIYTEQQHEPYVMDLCWVFTYSKIWEFLDTYLILAKGQPTIFLQKYHHVGALICWWLCCYYNSGQIHKTVLCNAFVHTIMYSYYLASLLGYKYTSVKPYITSLQLFQFVGLGAEVIQSYFIPTMQAAPSIQSLLNDGEFVSIVIFYVYLTGLISLFLQFFVSEYLMKKTATLVSPDTKSHPSAPPAHVESSRESINPSGPVLRHTLQSQEQSVA
jgi:GNS1/SUR4 family